MPQYIIRATRDAKTVREDVFESTGMEVALEHAKHVWHDIEPVGWLALHAGDYPQVVARITGKPWSKYRVTYEVRERGAIGIFWLLPIDVEATDEEAAQRAAFNEAQKRGYETRNPRKIERLLAP